MAIQRKYCPQCNDYGPATNNGLGVQHLAHAFLCFVTCGLWFPVWLLCWKFGMGDKANCNRCGSPV